MSGGKTLIACVTVRSRRAGAGVRALAESLLAHPLPRSSHLRYLEQPGLL